MSETPIFGLPRPDLPDAADGPGAFEDLSDRTEAVLAAGLRSSGSAIIAANQLRSAATYGLLGTPDRVQGLVVPDGGGGYGVLAVMYRATVILPSAFSSSFAALFIDGVQATADRSMANDGSTQRIATALEGPLDVTGDDDPAILALGGRLGLAVFALGAGTYEVSVRFKGDGTSALHVQNRRLFAFALGAGLPPP